MIVSLNDRETPEKPLAVTPVVMLRSALCCFQSLHLYSLDFLKCRVPKLQLEEEDPESSPAVGVSEESGHFQLCW